MIENNRSELKSEKDRLEKTISFAKIQLEQAKQDNEENQSAIISAKQELRENTSHSIANLWSSDGFEALAELSQYAYPITNTIAHFESTEKRIARLDSIIKSPYFSRIDFKFDGENDFEKIYIGRFSLTKENSYEIIVYDWRTPIASVFYRFVKGPAFYDAPSGRITGEVGLKRQYEINNGVLEYFFDSDVQIVDEILRKQLAQNTSPRMRTIVETIQKEQDIVIRDMTNDLMMVQGVAGSGKTSIALHRIAYLMYQGLSMNLSANNIIIISPNMLFEQYISNVLPELGEENAISVVFEEIVAEQLHKENIQSKNQFFENLITSSRYKDTMKCSMEFKTSSQFFGILNRFIEDIPHRWINFTDIYYADECIVGKDILKNKIVSGRSDVPLALKLEQLKEYVLEMVRTEKKKDIDKSEYARIKKEIQSYTEVCVENLYRNLFYDKEYFYGMAKDLDLPDCIEDILMFTQENLNSNLLYYDDAAALSYLHLKTNDANMYNDVKQVVIDEAQDYYPLHYEIFNLLFPKSKFTILGDVNQTIEKQEDITLYDQVKKILKKKKSSLVVMDKSFRCTNEILTYSSKFLDQNMEIQSYNRHGDMPKMNATMDAQSFQDMLVSEVNQCLNEKYSSIGLICKTEKNAHSLFSRLSSSIDVSLISDESVTDLHGVFIIPVYMSKGLEFDAVLVCDVDIENYNSEEDKKFLYIACTRALHRLNLFCLGDVSPLV